MGKVADPRSDQVKLGPWPKGMNNRVDEQELDDGFLRDALNVDITNAGYARRRRGYVALLAPAHSVFAHDDKFLFVSGGDLYLGLPPNHAIVRAGVGTEEMAYVELNGEIYFSNGVVTGKIDQNNTPRPWGIEIPNPVPVMAATAFGGMHAGTYQVALTYIDDRGEEGGGNHLGSILVPSGGGILISVLPTTLEPTVVSIRIYVSSVNDDLLFHLVTLPIGTPAYQVFLSGNLGREYDTDLMDPFPPCSQLAKYNGRIYGVDGRFLWYTEPLRYGLTKLRENFIPYASDIGVVAPVEDGIYVCADRTWWLDGRGPGEFNTKDVLPFGAVLGSAVEIGNSRNMAWFSKNGFMIGKAGGKVEQVSDAALAMPGYTKGATLFREQYGLRQLVTVLRGSGEKFFKSADTADAEVIRSTS